MPVENKKSTAVTNADASKQTNTPQRVANGRVREDKALFAAVTTDSIGSVYRAARVRSNATISQILLYNTAITSMTADCGLYRTQRDGGAVVDADFFASAVNLAAVQNGLDITHEAGGTGNHFGDITKLEMPLWQALGLSEDPNIDYDIAFTAVAAPTANGNFGAKVRWCDGN